MPDPILTIVVAIILIVGAVIAIPIMNRRRYGPRGKDQQPRS